MTTALNNNCFTSNDPLSFFELAEKRSVAMKSDIPRDRETDIPLSRPPLSFYEPITIGRKSGF